MFGDQITSLIRTYVPLGVGIALSWLSRKVGFIVDEQSQLTLTTVFTGFATAAYYTVARLLEKVNPKFGWLLGSAKAPTYTKN